jgi:hypothetical protein
LFWANLLANDFYAQHNDVTRCVVPVVRPLEAMEWKDLNLNQVHHQRVTNTFQKSHLKSGSRHVLHMSLLLFIFYNAGSTLGDDCKGKAFVPSAFHGGEDKIRTM